MEENYMREVALAVEAEVDGGGYSVGADAVPLPQPVPPDERRVSSPQSPEGDSFPPPVDALRLPGMDDVAVPPRDADSLRSMKMRELLLRDLPDGWVQRLLELEIKLGRWELGALVLWLSLPKSMRQPKTMKDLAESVFGVSARTLSEWLHRPGVEEAVMATRLASLADYVPDTLEALGELATTPDYRNIPAIRLLCNASDGIGLLPQLS